MTSAGSAANSPPPTGTNGPGPGDGAPSRALEDSLLEDTISLDDLSFTPNGPLLDDEGLSPDVSFDSLIDDLGPVGHQESERAPTTSEESN